MKEESFGAVAGFLAGILNALAVGPLDVVKVRFYTCMLKHVKDIGRRNLQEHQYFWIEEQDAR